MPLMKVTVFIDVLSHWCLSAQPALDALHATLADDLPLEIIIAPIGDGNPVGFTNAGAAWFYTRMTLAYGTQPKPVMVRG